MMVSLPDVNIWIALAAEGHVHHAPAREWFTAQADVSVAFCRITQMGLLRLLTNPDVMRLAFCVAFASRERQRAVAR